MKNTKSVMTDLQRRVGKLYQSAWQTEILTPVDTKRLDELHPSSFPYCGLRHMVEFLHNGCTDPTHEKTGAGKAYFCDVGTAAHQVIQDYIGQAAVPNDNIQLVGNWKCLQCNKIVHEKTAFKPCPHDPLHQIRYEELRVNFGNTICGRVDGVIKIDGKFFIIDYKTSSSYAIMTHQKTPKFPYKANKHQIESYCHLISQQYPDIPISGWFLLYMARDAPMARYALVGEEFSQEQQEKIRKRMVKYDTHFVYVRKLAKAIMQKKLGKDAIIEKLQPLIQQKPCKTAEVYRNAMKTEYSECLLGDTCKCWADAHVLNQYLRKLLD